MFWSVLLHQGEKRYEVRIQLGNMFYHLTVALDFQQCGILTCEDSDQPLQPPFKLIETPNGIQSVA